VKSCELSITFFSKMLFQLIGFLFLLEKQLSGQDIASHCAEGNSYKRKSLFKLPYVPIF